MFIATGKPLVFENRSQILFFSVTGAVGIALAISLDAIVRRVTVNEELDAKYEEQTTKLFGFVGGIALLTLVVNATSAGPMLRKLGLADTSDIREKILVRFGNGNNTEACFLFF